MRQLLDWGDANALVTYASKPNLSQSQCAQIQENEI